MTFFTSITTPLYSSSWSPNTTSQYAGTCIFLIALATIFRALLATRINLFQILAVVKYRRGGGIGYPYTADAKLSIRPWRANEAVIIASVDVLLAGIGYLLLVLEICERAMELLLIM
jgi:copper transporter 1